MNNESEIVTVLDAKIRRSVVITERLILVLGVIYRLAVVGGAGVLVWHGGTPWLLVAAVPLMLFAPKSSR